MGECGYHLSAEASGVVLGLFLVLSQGLDISLRSDSAAQELAGGI
jgi:hypothetical protein